MDADTGAYKWHYQTTPGETWDYNSNMDIVLADLDYDGQIVQSADARTENGFFYVINRANGKLIAAKPYVKIDWRSASTRRPAGPSSARARATKTAKSWCGRAPSAATAGTRCRTTR